MTAALDRLAGLVSRCNDAIGRAVAWTTIVLVVLACAIVIMRYVYGLSSLLMREAVLYLHGTLFLMAAAYTLRHDGHVRIDIIYERLGRRSKAWVDLLGTLIVLVPMAILILWTSIPFVRNSWAVLEGSIEGTGIPAVFLLKTVIPIAAVLILLQGLANAIGALAVIAGRARG
ncbi:MAG: TRAP transporter small permease subunit [Alphaproteobacteria bacterium]|nr:TRAP transporter small permease subunit [Alphaproteobacteria bacterium]